MFTSPLILAFSFATAISALLVAIIRPQPKPLRDILAIFVSGVVLLVISTRSFSPASWGWAVTGLALGAFLIFATISVVLFESLSNSALRRVWLTVMTLGIVMFAAGARVQWQNRRAADDVASAAAETKAVNDAVRLIESDRQIDSGEVRSATARPMIVWVAVKPKIAIDQDNEQKLGDAAGRFIPIRIVFLNNSYGDIAFSDNEPLWNLSIENDAGETMQNWSGVTGAGEFGPAERRDLILPWNGRDADGALVPPGTYHARLRTAALQPGGAIEIDSDIIISDEGPEGAPQLDPTTIGPSPFGTIGIR